VKTFGEEFNTKIPKLQTKFINRKAKSPPRIKRNGLSKYVPQVAI